MASVDVNECSDVFRPKKRAKNIDNWKRNTVKRLKKSRQSYISDKTNKHVPAKERGHGCDCTAKNKQAKQGWCEFHTLTEMDKDNLFIGFYKLGEYNSQNAFLWGLIKQSACKRAYKNKRTQNNNETRRTMSYSYF